MAGTIVTINQGTQTGIANDSVGGTMYQTIKLDMGTAGVSNPFSGTLPQVTNLAGGTITQLSNGSIVVTAGTVAAGSITVTQGTIVGGTLANLVSGTINAATAIINSATISVLPNTPGGTLGLITRIGNLGTLEVATITTIPNIPGGTVGLITRVGNVGTLEVATITTIPNIPGGTIALVTRTGNLGTLESGTISVIPKIPGGTVDLVTRVGNLGTLEAGTLSMILAGTLDKIASGTITTVRTGTVKLDSRTGINNLSYGTTFGGTAAGYATLVGSVAVGAGTSTWVTSVSVINPAGNITCMVGFGTALNGTSVLFKGTFGTTAAVGMQKEFPLPVNAGMTNQDLVAYISGAGTIDVNVAYFISA